MPPLTPPVLARKLTLTFGTLGVFGGQLHHSRMDVRVASERRTSFGRAQGVDRPTRGRPFDSAHQNRHRRLIRPFFLQLGVCHDFRTNGARTALAGKPGQAIFPMGHVIQ